VAVVRALPWLEKAVREEFFSVSTIARGPSLDP